MSLIVFSVVAGAIQMIAPDHWIPASIFSWQRGWRLSRTLLFTIPLFLIHIALGLGLYEVFAHLLSKVDESYFALFTFGLIGLCGVVRALRFSRLRQIVHRTPRSSTGFVVMMLLLGPSEMIIPVMMKVHFDSAARGLPLAAFALGTLIVGGAFVGGGRVMWNRPSALPRAIDWCHTRMKTYPVAVAASLGALLLLSFFSTSPGASKRHSILPLRSERFLQQVSLHR